MSIELVNCLKIQKILTHIDIYRKLTLGFLQYL